MVPYEETKTIDFDAIRFTLGRMARLVNQKL
jgi:hypothetical protein